MTILNKYAIIVGLAGSILACRSAPITEAEWPALTPENKPWSRWWWHGSSVTKAGITAELEPYLN